MPKQSKPILVENKRNPQEFRHITPADISSHHEHAIRKIEKEWMLYELWTKGELGLHKDKPLLKAVFPSAVTAERQMIKLLQQGHCAFVVKKKLPKTI